MNFNELIEKCKAQAMPLYVDADEKDKFECVSELHELCRTLQSKIFKTKRTTAINDLIDIDGCLVNLLSVFNESDRNMRNHLYLRARRQLLKLLSGRKFISHIFRKAPQLWPCEERLETRKQFEELIARIKNSTCND